MKVSYYQDKSQDTQKIRSFDLAKAISIAMFGLAGETGSLLAEYKKHIRDNTSEEEFKRIAVEELGDVFWYLANVSSLLGIDLQEVAYANLAKTRGRWLANNKPKFFYDEGFREEERFPRLMNFLIKSDGNVIRVFYNESDESSESRQLGDELRDNAYSDDGYRFHDVFHITYATMLGWSPVLRAQLKRKRKSMPLVDEVEDGGRAIVVEEAISILIYYYAKANGYLNGMERVDYELLKRIKLLTSDLEISSASYNDWETAILESYRVWLLVRQNKGGRLMCNLTERKMCFYKNL